LSQSDNGQAAATKFGTIAAARGIAWTGQPPIHVLGIWCVPTIPAAPIAPAVADAATRTAAEACAKLELWRGGGSTGWYTNLRVGCE
jgi:hypothetical protein